MALSTLNSYRYFIESSYPQILRKLLHDPIIQSARVTQPTEKSPLIQQKESSKTEDAEFGAVITLDQEDELDSLLPESDFVQAIELAQDSVENVKRRCTELDFPLMEEYDFRADDLNPNLDMDLSPKTIIRDYQEKSLSKMFGGGGGRARYVVLCSLFSSGIIVLPTGAGKTLVGITAACTIKKSTLVLCTNAYAPSFHLHTQYRRRTMGK